MTLEQQIAKLKLGILKVGVTFAKMQPDAGSVHVNAPMGGQKDCPKGKNCTDPECKMKHPPGRVTKAGNPNHDEHGRFSSGDGAGSGGKKDFNPAHYTAHALSRKGTTLHTTDQHPTREAAVAAAFRHAGCCAFGGADDIARETAPACASAYE